MLSLSAHKLKEELGNVIFFQTLTLLQLFSITPIIIYWIYIYLLAKLIWII